MTTKLEQQIKDWETLHKFMNDSRHMKPELQKQFLQNEVYSRLKVYFEKYGIKYDHLNKPK